MSESIIFTTWLSMPDAAITLTDMDKDECPRTITFARPYADEPATMPVSVAAAAPVLLAALKPFAAVAAADIGTDEANADLFAVMDARNARAPRLTVGDFRRALAAIAKAEGRS